MHRHQYSQQYEVLNHLVNHNFKYGFNSNLDHTCRQYHYAEFYFDIITLECSCCKLVDCSYNNYTMLYSYSVSLFLKYKKTLPWNVRSILIKRIYYVYICTYFYLELNKDDGNV